MGIHPLNRAAGVRALWREPAPLRTLARLDVYPWFVVGTVCIGAFMEQVDASIAQLVLPELEPEFHASVGAVAWVSVAYLLVVAAMLPVFGRLADMLGRKLLYSAGFLGIRLRFGTMRAGVQPGNAGWRPGPARAGCGSATGEQCRYHRRGGW